MKYQETQGLICKSHVNSGMAFSADGFLGRDYSTGDDGILHRNHREGVADAELWCRGRIGVAGELVMESGKGSEYVESRKGMGYGGFCRGW